VVVANVHRLRQLREGYESRPEDLHVLRLLDRFEHTAAN